MIGEGRCQWSLLAVSSHPVIWINLSLIGRTALKCGETNPFLVRRRFDRFGRRGVRERAESRRLNHFAGILSPAESESKTAAVIAPSLTTYLQLVSCQLALKYLCL